MFVIFYVTAVLLFTVYLRSADNRTFYKLCTIRSEQNRLKQEIWQKQLILENRTNPANILRQLEDQ